jgi:uncharacterized membrane protein YhaH (DUF805 family)
MESENLWMAAWNNFGDFSGRATRMEYWLYRLEITVVGVIIAGFYSLMPRTTETGSLPQTDPLLGIIILGVLAILSILLIIVDLGVTIRRLHDTGRSGWWIFLRVIPYIGSFIVFIFTVLDSEAAENKYGPSPKGLRSEIDQYLRPSQQP